MEERLRTGPSLEPSKEAGPNTPFQTVFFFLLIMVFITVTEPKTSSKW